MPEDDNERAGRLRRSNRWSRPNRVLIILVGGLLALAVAAGCGDESTAEEAYCEAGDNLQNSVDALRDLDVVAEGTGALDERIGNIKDDLETLKGRAGDVASDEIAALNTAIEDAQTARDELGDNLTAAGAQDVLASVSEVVDASRSVRDTLSAACG